MIEEQIQKDIVLAMKEKDSARLNALRNIKSKITLAKTSGKCPKVFGDDEVIAIIKSMMKQLDEDAMTYLKNGRNDLADKELEERKYVASYLPKMHSYEYNPTKY